MNREALLAEVRRYLRPCAFWEAWLGRTGEGPPDFEALPALPDLPDPLNFQGGRVQDSRDWPAARECILAAFRHYIFGAWPPPPGAVSAQLISERSEPGGEVLREVLLSFGPQGRATLHAQLALPPGPGPFPVFMTQRNHVGWARVALARGYAAVLYDGCDDADDSQAFQEFWPGHDWSKLCRRAWAAGRVLDWLHTLSQIDRARACIVGHSRNGKLALICGAIDPRFNVVISSSSGIGGATPYRLANEAHFGEGLELLTFSFKEWLHPRARFFAGREHLLPVDANLLLALSAPRAVLVSTALNDSCESLKANEAAIRSAGKVWSLLGARSGLGLLLRSGGHDTRAEEAERFVDWCDLHFGRLGSVQARAAAELFQPSWHFPYSFSEWQTRSGETLDPSRLPDPQPLAGRPFPGPGEWHAGRGERLERIRLLLGEEPATASRPPSEKSAEPPYLSALLKRPATGGSTEMEALDLGFGESLTAKLWLRAGTLERVRQAGLRIPLAIWAPPDSTSCGFSAAYFQGRHPPGLAVLQGVAALAFDLLGTGSRLPERAAFYRRYPRWSLLGKHVRDLRAAVEAARGLAWVDPARIYLYGFGVGGTAALVAAALDEGIAGVGVVSGFSPLRGDTQEQPTGGLARYGLWEGEGLLPRLGFFAGGADRTRKVPIDFEEILASIAPRPLFCCAPRLDREVNHGLVVQAAQAVARIYQGLGAGEAFVFRETDDHRRLSKDSENSRLLLQWLVQQAGIPEPAG